jgi:methionine aminopeptidase
VSAERSNLLNAAHTVSDLALRYFSVGKTTQDVSKLLEMAIADFSYQSVQGTISFELARDTLGSGKYIIVSATPEQRKASKIQTLEPYDVFAIDVALTSSDGAFVPSATSKPWIYRKTENTQSIKTKSGRSLYAAIQNKFGRMAFHSRTLQPPIFEKASKLGLSELLNRQLIQGYETLFDRLKKPVARFMFTVIVTPNGPIRITHWDDLADHVKPTNSLKQPDLLQILASDPRSKKKMIL